MRVLKSNSSPWVQKTFSGFSDFYWQSGYGVLSVSQSQCAKVTEYIRRQEEHHAAASFKEEFIGLLKAHGVDYDERYIWD